MDLIEHSIAVAGGDLTVFTSGPRPTEARSTVLLIHGITASSKFMAPVADVLDEDLFVVSVDLRGRGGSAALPGPAGMRSHVDDMAAVLRSFEAEECIVVGHSMGAYVATMFAKRHPCPTVGLVLIDGGFPIPMPDAAPTEEVLSELLGPALARFSMEVESRESYLNFFKTHPALQDWNSYMEAYVEYDLGPDLRPRGSIDLISQDGRELMADDEVREALSQLTLPIELVRAGRGLLNQPQALINERVAQKAATDMTNLTLTNLPDLNHYTVVLSPTGSSAVVNTVERLIS